MKLSERLETIYGMVYKCDTVADVGCDHGYLSIALVENRVAKRAIAMDINKGPLESAGENIELAGLSGQIETRLSDGLDQLKSGEADVICICGMGGLLMSRILMDHMDVAQNTRCLVLEPQSEYMDLRRTLADNGFIFEAEKLVCEKNKYYPVIRAVYAPKVAQKCRLTDTQLAFGPKLIEDKNPLLLDYLSQQLNRCTRLLNHLEAELLDEKKSEDIKTQDKAEVQGEIKEQVGNENETATARRIARQQQLRTDIDMISEVQKYFWR